jgi:nucleoside-diphosphate-sugar epimerase
MNVLVTGGAGYLGSVLVPKLLARGHKVRVSDVGYFGVSHLRSYRSGVELIREDLTRILNDKKFGAELVRDMDCIISLAAISNDPSAELYPELTTAVNVDATVALAQIARSKKVRFIFSSSCSVYGEVDGAVDEESPLDPLSLYAVSKLKCEEVLRQMAEREWSPIILRNGTLFGYSARMRFDLVVNIFSLYSTLHNAVKVFGRGDEWRPFLHVSDCARAMVFVAEKTRCRHMCYNVAHENLRVIDVARIFAALNPRLKISHIELPNQDARDYRVSAKRLEREGFRTRVGVASGAEEMNDAIVSGVIEDPESIFYRNVKWLKELTEVGSKSHLDLMTLMETMAHVSPPKKPHGT